MYHHRTRAEIYDGGRLTKPSVFLANLIAIGAVSKWLIWKRDKVGRDISPSWGSHTPNTPQPPPPRAPNAPRKPQKSCRLPYRYGGSISIRECQVAVDFHLVHFRELQARHSSSFGRGSVHESRIISPSNDQVCKTWLDKRPAGTTRQCGRTKTTISQSVFPEKM